MADNCTSCNTLKTNAPGFIVNGITGIECTSLQNNTGLNPNANPARTNCQDLDDVNNCLIGNLKDKLPAVDLCDVMPFLGEMLNNEHIVNEAMICWMCGMQANLNKLNNNLDQILQALGSINNVIPVFKSYRYTLKKENFVWWATADTVTSVNGQNLDFWWGNGGTAGGNYIDIPITDMDSVTSVLAQTFVAGFKECMQTVNVQTYKVVGNFLRVDFDAYEFGLKGEPPYDVAIDFVVFGKKKFNLIP